MTARWWDRLNAHPRSRDALVAGVSLLIGLALLQGGATRLWPDTALLDTGGTAFLLALLGMVAIATQRSTRPFIALALGAAVTAVDLLHGGSLGVILVFFDLVYCALKYGGDRGVRIAVWIAVALAALTGAGLLLLRPESAAVPVVAVQWALIVATAGMWGWNVRSERLRTRALLAEQHARATQRMRQRIAHDLHDLVSNQIAVAGLHVEAARLRIERSASAPLEALSSLDRATEGAEQAHRQLRRLIAVLTTVDDLGGMGEGDPFEQLEGLAALPPGDRRLVWAGAARRAVGEAVSAGPPERAAVVLRVLRELVANAVKHGRGDIVVAAEARPRESPDRLEVTVRNASAPNGAPAPGRGIGIVGAALLLDGTGARLESGPETPGEHWCATLTLPLGGGSGDLDGPAEPAEGEAALRSGARASSGSAA